MEEINKKQVTEDLEKIMEHLNNMNKEMQKLYIKISDIIKNIMEVNNDG